MGQESRRTEAVYCRAGEPAMWHQELRLPLPPAPGRDAESVAEHGAVMPAPGKAAADDKVPAPAHVKIRVYHQVVREHSHADAPSSTVQTVPQARQCCTVTHRLLASARVSLQSLAAMQPVQLQAPLRPPPALLGYGPVPSPPSAVQDSTVAFHATLIGKAAVADAPPAVPAAGERFLTSSESATLLAQEVRWRASSMRKGCHGGDRSVYGVVCTLDGTGVCLTRLVAAAELPPAVKQQMARLQQTSQQQVRSSSACCVAVLPARTPQKPSERAQAYAQVCMTHVQRGHSTCQLCLCMLDTCPLTTLERADWGQGCKLCRRGKAPQAKATPCMMSSHARARCWQTWCPWCRCSTTHRAGHLCG